MTEFFNIETKLLAPHPHNPRKDLGDLTELADSIRARGILQNLTVVKACDGHCTTCEHFHGGNASCAEDYQDEFSKLIHLPSNEGKEVSCPKWEWSGRYTVIIGHRRLASAKLAGLSEVPCFVTEMDEKTQLATMLLENIQRSDLTTYEEAEGFQMMIDFGTSIGEIAESTGFSQSTIRRRVKLLDLDRDKFRDSVERGATLSDYAELDKIESVDLKNEVLDAIGTSNFSWKLKNAQDKEKTLKRNKELEELCATFATPYEDSSGLNYVGSYDSIKKITDWLAAPGSNEGLYFFKINDYGGAVIYRQQSDSDEAAAIRSAEQLAARNERSNQFKAMNQRAYELRISFVREFNGAKKAMGEVIKFATQTLIGLWGNWARIDGDLLLEFLDNIEDFDYDERSSQTLQDVFVDYLGESPEKGLFIAAYCTYGDDARGYNDFSGKYQDNYKLDILYAFLEKFGYEASDEERALADGTHELYVRSEVGE